MKVLTPNEYSKSKKASIVKKWNEDTVSRILTNETYTGVLIQGKNKRINYKIKKQVQTEESEWFITKNHHDSIVSEEIFEKVQYSLSRKKDYSKNADILNGYLKCIDCSSGLTVRKSKGKTYYNCSSYIRNKDCKSHSIKREKLIELTINDINKEKQSNFFDLTSNIINEFIDKILVIDKNTIKVIYK